MLDKLNDEWARLCEDADQLGPRSDPGQWGEWLNRAADFANRCEAAGFPNSAKEARWAIGQLQAMKERASTDGPPWPGMKAWQFSLAELMAIVVAVTAIAFAFGHSIRNLQPENSGTPESVAPTDTP